mgnify:CR=1 FL=1
MKRPLLGRTVRRLFNRRVIIAVLILAQIALLVVMLLRLAPGMQLTLTVFSVVTALHLMTRPDKSGYKLSLVFLILLLPVFGGAFYWIFHFQTTSVGFRRGLRKSEEQARPAMQTADTKTGDVYRKACEIAPESSRQIRYLERHMELPLYRNTQTRYFANGRDMLGAMLEDLQHAERYILLEYFIIEQGKMWDAILEVLCERVKAGVEVRILYDDLGCFVSLPSNYAHTLRAKGIQCALFNPFHPFLTSIQNNRDHRKITVIDGKVAYTGGINLADEYIGEKIKHGRWKDSALRLEGDGAWGFSVMFLQMWSFVTRKAVDFDAYRPQDSDAYRPAIGWVQPYTDSPIDKENVGEHIYLRMIEQAQKYLYITTPYLVIDDNMISALTLCAKSGVDVRIITPEVPDKRAVHFTTRSYYKDLIRAGVRIYEYKGGFIHAKTVVSDDLTATVGTTNFDFRSFYLHFECGVCLYRTASIADIKSDFLQTMEQSRLITERDCKASLFKKLRQNIARIFAPLM